MAVKANNITLGDLFRIDAEMDNFLQSQRMFISSADAWGTLIKDLTLTLGIERAKRFLLRYGYQCGRHEAEVLKDMFEWENKKEWVLAGVTMHNLSGRTSSVPTKAKIDTETGEFDVEGFWNNSYEAKQYLQHFPFHSEPVCYFLEGYASGYCSTSFGRKVVFKEIECIGKGDKHCHFVGKTLELWGDEISIDSVDYAREDIGDELDWAYKRIESQSEILKRGNILSNQLTQIVLQGKGLGEIAQTLGKSLQCGIVISNQYFETITEYGQVFNYSLKNIIDNKEKLRASDQKKMEEMINKQATIQLNTLEEQEFFKFPLITPIVVQNNIYGYISIIKNSKEIEELEPSFIERAANICALHLLNEKTVIETEHRMKGEMLNEILLQPNLDSSIAKRLSYLGYSLNKPHFVFIFRLQNQNLLFKNDKLLTKEKDLIANILRKHSEYEEQKILVSNYFGQIQALIPEDILVSRKISAQQYGEAIMEEVKRIIPTSQLLIGISNLCLDINNFHHGFKQAKKALEIAQITNQQQRVILFSELGPISILLDARNPEELESYADKVLGPMYDYDVRKSTELLKTLYFYLDNECNLHKTARYMNLSIGGMRYRLLNISERFNIDMMNSSTRREVQLALDIYLAFGKLPFMQIQDKI
ncbi:XylR N-terminal domain-containing protein [Peribacillus sp. NPDC097895]|uniref:XylR N-terminal domain-containing protein n=1 Tax=Peribacillus sp. NPDC097895 TaxID=3390619 RepID=UPI003D09372C